MFGVQPGPKADLSEAEAEQADYVSIKGWESKYSCAACQCHNGATCIGVGSPTGATASHQQALPHTAFSGCLGSPVVC